MALFLTSYAPSTFPPTILATSTSAPFPSSVADTADTSPRHAAAARLHENHDDTCGHNPFIKLLSLASLCDTPILPLTWEPAFEQLGLDGATGSVHQNLLNARLSLAFKRFRPFRPQQSALSSEDYDHAAAAAAVNNNNDNNFISESEREFRHQQFDAMATEMMVLRCCPEVSRHPNIIEFVGLCFELAQVRRSNSTTTRLAGLDGDRHKDGGADADARADDKDVDVNDLEVWPVLVFTKVNRGDLANFKDRHHRGQRHHHLDLDLDQDLALGICREVSKALGVLHRNNIVHGDIKPSNILVAEDAEADSLSVALADFGFSRFAENSQDGLNSLVHLARSEPWDAPEWTHALTRLRDAKKMDVYSFGMLCLWLFFADQKPNDEWGSDATLHDAFTARNRDAFEELQYRKRTGNDVLKLAYTLVERHETYTADTKDRLKKVFALSLEDDPDKRTSGMDELIKVFGQNDEDDDNGPGIEETSHPDQGFFGRLMDWHGSLQMEKLFFSLESCDYRIHAFITKSLAAMADGQGCTTCAQNAALQLLFCNAIGFGLDLDQEQTNHYLGKSGKDISTVQQTIQRIKNDNKKTDTIMAILAQQGYRHDFPTTYDRDGVLKDAIEYYRRALAKRKSLFDPGHFTMLRLQGLLVGLLRQNDRFEEAMEVALEMDIIADRLNTVDQLEIKTDLARLHLSLGNVEEAVALNRQVAEIHATFSKRDKTTERLDNQRHLAKALIKQGDFKAAISRASDTLRDCLKELGELHTSTIGVQRCLAEAYSAAGEIELAVKTRKDLVQAEDRLVSKESIDPKFVQDICILGVQCYRTNDLDSAKECYGKVHLLIRRDKRLATHAVDAVSNCAFERIRQDDNETALIILEKLLPETTKVVGTHCPEAALVMGNLAWLYSQQGDHNRAEAFQRQVLEVRQETLGRSHVHTITAMGDLRVTLLAQGQHDEAFILGEQEIEAVAGRSNASVSDIVEAAETVAGTLESAGAYAQAIRFFETEARLTGVDTMSMSVTSLPSMARAAHCYFHLGDLVKARQMTIAVLSRAPQSSSKELANLFSYLLPLAMEFLDRGCLPESEQILAMAAILQQQGLSAEATESSNLETLIERYLGLRQIDSFEVTFDPSKLVQ